MPDRISNRVTTCPVCGGRLGNDKSPTISDIDGRTNRKRVCEDCGCPVRTKQEREHITNPDEIALYKKCLATGKPASADYFLDFP